MKKLISKAALLLAAALALPTSANAVVYWDWSWSGTGFYTGDTGSGTLTTNDLSGTSYLITDMTGTWNGANITGLLALGTEVDPGYPINNLLFDSPFQIRGNGVGFSTDAGNVNLYVSDQYVAFSDSTFEYRNGTFTATIAPIPEPETYALMLAGLALVGAAARRRRARA